MALTPEEIQQFKDQKDLKLADLDSSKNYKSNLLIIERNFKTLTNYLNALKAFLIGMLDLLDVDNIIDLVLQKLQGSKIVINLPATILIDQVLIVQVFGKNYVITKTDNYTITIQGSGFLWDVDNLITEMKQTDGTKVYPVIKTKNNMITINNSEGFLVGYNLIIL